MKTAKKLLRKAARANDITIDKITGKSREFQLFGEREFDDVIIGATLNKRGRITSFDFYSDSGLYVDVDVKRPKRFINDLGDQFSSTFVFSAQSFADQIDELKGVEKGPFSTYVNLNGEYAFS